jgi:glutamate/tyrosine decarboxylase-like PLP-dependent enzyme
MTKKAPEIELPPPESLDPENWDEVRELGHRMIDDMTDYLKHIGRQPVWRKLPQQTKEKFKKGLPVTPQPLEKVYAEFKNNILPYSIGNIHPRFWSWVMGTGSVQGMLAEMLAAAMNSNAGIGEQAPMYVDQQVIEWCREIMNFPSSASGALVSNASAANLNALIVARNAANLSVRKKGLSQQKEMTLYASVETHSCIQKAAEIIGIGSDQVRKVRVNEWYEMDTAHLEELIRRDKENGFQPFCVVANVGTVNTGAIDPLDKIFFICLKYNCWFHIDGAFGALLKLLPEFCERLRCIALADSIAFDLHKWMYIPYEAAVVLVKDANKHRAAFALQPEYLLHHSRGIAAGPELTSNFGFDLSRNFKALKVWMLLKEHGIEKYKRLIRQNLLQAKYLGALVQSSPKLQLMAPVSTNIVCFRYYKPGLNTNELNELNGEILMQLHESGIAAPSYTKLDGNYCLRAAIVNHRSVKEDFEKLVSSVIELGNRLTQAAENAIEIGKKRVA